ncbi:hypothetical protein PHYPSEUDO_001804 [Phytophthora pseudosyringae]|uniref:Uncharacterized protein n=1 Tax=Phytophthora pseudosyringae TaxID=221518 RepID=A0A8T1VW74_9STRA|nr:hypothetical protein PHYPSEUDO_001804 [Phytophthora pseudosyringae]
MNFNAFLLGGVSAPVRGLDNFNRSQELCPVVGEAAAFLGVCVWGGGVVNCAFMPAGRIPTGVGIHGAASSRSSLEGDRGNSAGLKALPTIYARVNTGCVSISQPTPSARRGRDSFCIGDDELINTVMAFTIAK